jgi:hypothetical protein
MKAEAPSQSPLSPLYRKALEIFTLAKFISQYMVYDMSGLKADNKEHPDIYKTGDMVRQSEFLIPKVYWAENEVLSEAKEKHIYSLRRLTQSLSDTCNQLEKSVSHGKDFLSVLQKEIVGFKKLQQSWEN